MRLQDKQDNRDGFNSVNEIYNKNLTEGHREEETALNNIIVWVVTLLALGVVIYLIYSFWQYINNLP